jgi:hypothetical protein
MGTRWNHERRDDLDLSKLIEDAARSDDESSEVRKLESVSDVIDFALEWGDRWHETERTWLVFNEGGSMIGEVQARMGLLAVLKAYLQWPPQKHGPVMVRPKEMVQAERN